jgi:endonuclease YncB( thermonuclease family)
MLFGWGKRNEGFEWREYVRTTILVRRADRQKRLDDARLAALAKVKDAKDRGVHAGIAGVEAVRDGAAAAGQRAGQAVAGVAVAGAAKVAGGARAAAGAVAGAAAALPKPQAPTVLKRSAADLAMYAADIPRRWRLLKPYLLPGAGLAAAVFVFGAALSPEIDGTISGGQGNTAGAAQLAAVTPSSTGSISASQDNVIAGRASATSGDLLRVGNKLVRLAGIEAPQPAQPCLNSKGRRWSCAASARDALYRLVRGRRVACELKDASGSTPPLAHCRTADTDIAAALVRKGHVFAGEDGTYAGDEEAARANKAGLWQGQAERPGLWRSKVWEEAKRTSPEGCPIKGIVRRGNRIYAMPWSEGYSGRSIRKVRGERWFCSEDEARAAGFKDSQL